MCVKKKKAKADLAKTKCEMRMEMTEKSSEMCKKKILIAKALQGEGKVGERERHLCEQERLKYMHNNYDWAEKLWKEKQQVKSEEKKPKRSETKLTRPWLSVRVNNGMNV